MKKIIASAAALALGGTLLVTSVQAFESQFGGYWRTRFDVMDNGARYPGDTTWVMDTRTRLYYTAKFSDQLKFVNKFEFNNVWGNDNGGGIGADATGTFRIKNSYVDAKFGAINVKVGAHAFAYGRGLVFDDDFFGLTVSGAFGAMTPTFVWAHTMDEDWGSKDYDQDFLYGGVKIKAGDTVTVTPSVAYLTGGTGTVDTVDDAGTVTGQETVGGEDLLYISVDVDATFDPVKTYGTFVYQTGDMSDNVDTDAYAVVLGADAGIVRGAFYYTSGEDGGDPTQDDTFKGISAYRPTAEIMGVGLLDGYRGPVNTGWGVENFMLANVGTSLRPWEGYLLRIDGWYGALAENNEFGNDDVGFEIDGKITFSLLENLKVDAVIAYLIAGDATNDAAGNSDDVFEAGMRLSLSF